MYAALCSASEGTFEQDVGNHMWTGFRVGRRKRTHAVEGGREGGRKRGEREGGGRRDGGREGAREREGGEREGEGSEGEREGGREEGGRREGGREGERKWAEGRLLCLLPPFSSFHSRHSATDFPPSHGKT